jgi:catechol 2,3-dioxygenase-like lactoylglutathione lyase family enzyme
MTDPLDALRLPVIPVEPRPEFTEHLRQRIEGREQHRPAETTSPGATVRYFVTDLDGSVAFYRDVLGFDAELVAAPAFAMLYRGDLRLLLSVPGRAGGGTALPDGAVPAPGGWNRIAVRVDDLDAAVAALRARGVRFRTGITSGVAVRQVLLHDPSGNLIELFEPGTGYRERSPAPAG